MGHGERPPAAYLQGSFLARQASRVLPGWRRIASASHDLTIKLWNAASGALLATLFIHDGKGMVFHPEWFFVFGAVDPRAAFAIVRGSEKLPMDDFVALDRRDSLADALAPRAAAAK